MYAQLHVLYVAVLCNVWKYTVHVHVHVHSRSPAVVAMYVVCSLLCVHVCAQEPTSAAIDIRSGAKQHPNSEEVGHDFLLCHNYIINVHTECSRGHV